MKEEEKEIQSGAYRSLERLKDSKEQSEDEQTGKKSKTLRGKKDK